MSIVKIKDKTFKTSITEDVIKARVKEVAQQISKDMAGKTPLFLGVLNGSFIFAADLMREMTIPCEISFVKLASYRRPDRTYSDHCGGYRGERSDHKAHDRIAGHEESGLCTHLYLILQTRQAERRIEARLCSIPHS